MREEDGRAQLDAAEEIGKRIGMELGKELGIELGENKKEKEAVIGFHEIYVSVENIAKALKITEEKVRQIIAEYEREMRKK